MPWKALDIMSGRMEFYVRLARGERMSDLCREYGITRTTGYKFKARYERAGVVGLADQSRAPLRPRRVAAHVREKIVALRCEHPTWGPRKLRKTLATQDPGVVWPATSTIGEILNREGLVKKRSRKHRQLAFRDVLTEPKAPNDVWAMDYKGEFRLGNRQYCYPLTVSDLYSRHVHACEAFERIDTDDCREVFIELFERYGLPRSLRSDNGSPFASARGLLGLTRLSAWFVALDIRLERIKPGSPQQNGSHERMHRTLKAEACRPAEQHILRQQQRFDLWKETFNNKRPHEALDLRIPADVYEHSTRSYAEPKLEYPLHDDAPVVSSSGHVRLLRRRGGQIYLSAAFAGYPIGVREIESGNLLLTFANLNLGYVDPTTMVFHRADQAPGDCSVPCQL